MFQLADDVLHLLHVLGGTRLEIGLDHPQRGGIFIHRGDKTPGQRLHRLLVLRRALDDLIVDIGNVAHIGHAVAGAA